MSSGTGFSGLDDLLNVVTNISTSGLVGYNDKGFKAGVTGKPIVEGTKEITGAKAAEEANQLAREQFLQSVEQAKKDREESIVIGQRNQISASQDAATARSKIKTNTTKSVDKIGDVTDFLGL